MFDIERAPKVFKLTPATVTSYVTRYRDSLQSIVNRIEGEILGDATLPEANRKSVSRYLSMERRALVLVEEMLGSIGGETLNVSRKEWMLLERDFPELDVDDSVAKIKAIAFGDANFSR